ncbi:MAG: hypothetical protein QNK11_01370 [Legionella sp.]|nr:hypothetical protein [Legionella sp.]
MAKVQDSEIYCDVKALMDMIDGAIGEADEEMYPERAANAAAAAALSNKLSDALDKFENTQNETAFRKTCCDAINQHKNKLIFAPGRWNQVKAAINDFTDKYIGFRFFNPEFSFFATQGGFVNGNITFDGGSVPTKTVSLIPKQLDAVTSALTMAV